MTREQALRTAAKWWADKLRKRAPHSNGDNSEASVFACIFSDLLARDPELDKKLPMFQCELMRATADQMYQYPSMYTPLCSDYGPSGPLAAAAKAAGINQHCFPYKTSLIIECMDGKEYRVRVKEGYGQPFEYLSFTEEDDHDDV